MAPRKKPPSKPAKKKAPARAKKKTPTRAKKKAPAKAKKKAPASPRWPRWAARQEDVNLRAVAPGIHVGAELAPGYRPGGRHWYAAVDLYGESDNPPRAPLYQGIPIMLRFPFYDGATFPAGCLDAIMALTMHARSKRKTILIHCQAGLSRSASAAYAMLRVLDGLSHDEALARVKVKRGWPMLVTIRSARRWVRIENS